MKVFYKSQWLFDEYSLKMYSNYFMGKIFCKISDVVQMKLHLYGISYLNILKLQYCYEHDKNYSRINDDGPPPRKIFCCYYRVRDVNFSRYYNY